MNDLKISGYGDDLTINNCKIGDLSPKEHKNIELKLGGQNYSPLEDVIVSHVKDSSTLICRKPSSSDVEKYIDVELFSHLIILFAIFRTLPSEHNKPWAYGYFISSSKVSINGKSHFINFIFNFKSLASITDNIGLIFGDLLISI